jgi:hypothetical protein
MTLLVPYNLDGFYARPARLVSGSQLMIVLFVPTKLSVDFDTTFATWLKQNGAELRSTEGDRNFRCWLLACPAWLRSALLQAVPLPPSHGSLTLGNWLPW